MSQLKITLYVIAAAQVVLGLLFLLVPGQAADVLGLEPAAPDWVAWLFAMMAARFLGFGFGMAWAARHPDQAASWVDAMIGVQALDWLATVAYLAAGDVTLSQVTTASFLPVVFVVALVRYHPRRLQLAAASGRAGVQHATA